MKNSRLEILTALALTLASGVGYALTTYTYNPDSFKRNKTYIEVLNLVKQNPNATFEELSEDTKKELLEKNKNSKRSANIIFKQISECAKDYIKNYEEQSSSNAKTTQSSNSQTQSQLQNSNIDKSKDLTKADDKEKTNEYDFSKFSKVLPDEKKETPTYFPKDSNTKTPTSADVGAGLGDFLGALKKYDAKNATTDKGSLPNASTTETKDIKNLASEETKSENKAINKDDCEYTTAKEGQELDQIFREKFGDPKDNPEAYELFKQLNPKYVAPGEKVYFPPADAIAELKKTNSGNDVAKKQDTETANSIDKSKCKSVKAQSGQQMVDIFKKEFGEPKDNPEAYKLFQQLNPEFVAPDALVYFPTKEAIEAEKEKSKKSKEAKDVKDDKSKKDAKNKEAEIKAEIEKINKKLDDNTKKAISGLEKNNKDAYDKIVKDPKEYKRIAELIKNNPNEYIKEVYQTGNPNRTPSLVYFDKSLANLKKTNSSKYSELRAQYEKDYAVAIEGGQSYHNGSYFEVTNLVIVDVYGNKKKVSYSADGKRVETSN